MQFANIWSIFDIWKFAMFMIVISRSVDKYSMNIILLYCEAKWIIFIYRFGVIVVYNLHEQYIKFILNSGRSHIFLNWWIFEKCYVTNFQLEWLFSCFDFYFLIIMVIISGCLLISSSNNILIYNMNNHFKSYHYGENSHRCQPFHTNHTCNSHDN